MNANNTLISKDNLDKLFSAVGVETTLDRIEVYFYYRCVYLWIDDNINPADDYYFEMDLQRYSSGLISKFYNPHLLSHRAIRVMWSNIFENTLYQSIALIDLDTFFKTYFTGYLGYANPMRYLNSFYKRKMIKNTTADDLLILFHYLLSIKEEYTEECTHALYRRLSAFDKPFIPAYDTFCQIWIELFVIPKISEEFSQYYFNSVADALSRLGINIAYKKALIILYSVLYRDYRSCEKADILVEKLRDGNDSIKVFDSPQAVFSLKNNDESKPRFLNQLFETTVPSDFKYELPGNKEPWKADFSIILKFLGRCLLNLSIDLLLPEIFPSTAAVISYLSQYPGRKDHSTDRGVAEIICAYLYALDSADRDRVAVFKSFLENTLQRDGLSNYEEIYEHLDKLRTSFAVMSYSGERKFKNIISDAKSVLTTTAQQSDKALFEQYLTTTKKRMKTAQKLNDTPALNLLMETQNNSCLVEDSILFEETANYVLHSNSHRIILLQPSYSFLLIWLSDYRTKNRKTTVVNYDEHIVRCMNEKLQQNNLVSKELFYGNQKTSYDLQIVSSIDGIENYDLAVTFFNKKEPNYKDLISLSRLITNTSRMICVLPRRYFENDEFESIRKEMLSCSAVRRVTYIDTALFTQNPKKKFIVELCKKDDIEPSCEISMRFIEIDRELQGTSHNLVKSDLGVYYLSIPTEGVLFLDTPYTGDSINFKEVYRSQNEPNPKEKQSRGKAREIRMATDFTLRYTMTKHGKSQQGKVYFASYLKPSKAVRRKKDYGEKIKGSQVTLSAEDDRALERRIIEEFPSSDKFKKLRAVAAEAVRSAYEKGILGNISLFSFMIAYLDDIERFYVSSFDLKFCYRVLCGTSLGSLILNEATQDDFDKAIAELESDIIINSFKLLDQLGKILDIAVKRAVLFDSRSPIFPYLEGRKKRLIKKAQMRDAFTLKSFTHEQEARLIEWLLARIPEKPVFLGTIIKLFTGMSSPEVCMLTWGDFFKRKSSTFYQFRITKQMDWKKGKETVQKGLSSSFKYRLVPIPEYLAELILAYKTKYIQEFGILSEKELKSYPLIVSDYKGKEVRAGGKVKKHPVYCTANKLRLNSKTAKEDGAGIPEDIISYESIDGTEEHDLNEFNGDFYESNFKYHAINDAMMTRGQVSFILGLTPEDTFTRHYCDYKNPSLQKLLVEKLNDWCALYNTWDAKPQHITGTIQNSLEQTIYPFTADCTSGQLRIRIDHQLQSDIEITIASDRGTKGTITMYEENSNEK